MTKCLFKTKNVLKYLTPTSDISVVQSPVINSDVQNSLALIGWAGSAHITSEMK